MNAKEIANEGIVTQLAVVHTMLPKVKDLIDQQADRIAELENQLDKCSHYEAMAHQGGYEIGKASQIKDLTDDEIRILINEVPDYNIDIHDLMEFARAILKKASEK